jgi:ABC-2 type transport system ATP-binding protein
LTGPLCDPFSLIDSASPDAAVAVAAYDVLLVLIPTQLTLIEDAYVAALAAIPNGAAKTSGLAVGGAARGKTVLLTTHLMEEAERLCDRMPIIERGRVIDIGTPLVLVRKYCPEQMVVLVTEDPSARERFEQIPGVDAVLSQDTRYTIRGRGDDFVTDVIQCLSEHRTKVAEFRAELPNLEDVFLRLTGHSIRD